MTLQHYRDQKAACLEEARMLQAKGTMTPQDSARFDDLLNQIRAADQHIQDAMALDGLSDPQDAAYIAGNAAPYDSARVSIGNQPAVYKNLGEQMLDVMAMTTGSDMRAKSAAADRYQKIVNAAGGSTGSDGEGGYLVETQHSKNILTTAIDAGALASRCSRQPIGANADSYSYLAAKDRDRSTGRRNGIQVYRKGEATAMESSGKAALEERELRLEDLYGLVYVTNRMLRDAPAMAAHTKRCLREQLAFKLDMEIWEGSGSGECLGVTKSDLPVVVQKETDQAAKTIVAQNVVNMLARFRGDIRKAAWFVNQDCLPQLPLMVLGDKPIYLQDFKNSPFGGLLSLPVVPVEYCATLGSQNDIMLADWSQYLLITKGGIEATESIHVRFLTDETAFRFIARNNGQPLHDHPIIPLNGTNTLSPFVTLAERA